MHIRPRDYQVSFQFLTRTGFVLPPPARHFLVDPQNPMYNSPQAKYPSQPPPTLILAPDIYCPNPFKLPSPAFKLAPSLLSPNPIICTLELPSLDRITPCLSCALRPAWLTLLSSTKIKTLYDIHCSTITKKLLWEQMYVAISVLW